MWGLKLHRRRLPVAGFVALCFLLSYVNMLFKNYSDSTLDSMFLEDTENSLFSPRTPLGTLLDLVDTSKPNSPMKALGGIHFHWDDWLDLSAGDLVLAEPRRLAPLGSCDLRLEKFLAFNPYFLELYATKVARGMANLYCTKSVPSRVLVSVDDGFLEVAVADKQRVGLENMPAVTKQALLDKVGLLPQPLDLPAGFGFIPYQAMRQTVDVDVNDFIFDLDHEILTLKRKIAANGMTAENIAHLEFLEHSNAIVDSSDRFFKYPWIYTDVVKGRLHHLLFPFFKRYISNRERQSVIQHMIRVWFRFAEAAGVVSWVNYGSLLGWAFNGVDMPWDTDVDIQIPIAQLDKLSRKYNSTLITEHPRDGNGKYLFEVSPTYVRQGNGRNFIDARFIEINSGLYIDISVLAHTSDPPPAELTAALSETEKLEAIPVHCKNWNWHLVQELLPVRHTYLEASSIYIPRNILSILTRKYGASSFTDTLHFNGYTYSKDLMLWVPDSEDMHGCTVTPAENSLGELSPDCQSSWIKDEFMINRDAAWRHKLLDSNIDEPILYDLKSCPELPLSRKDPWEYFEDINSGKSLTADWYHRS